MKINSFMIGWKSSCPLFTERLLWSKILQGAWGPWMLLLLWSKIWTQKALAKWLVWLHLMQSWMSALYIEQRLLINEYEIIYALKSSSSFRVLIPSYTALSDFFHLFSICSQVLEITSKALKLVFSDTFKDNFANVHRMLVPYFSSLELYQVFQPSLLTCD